MAETLVAAIDQGTTSTRVLVFTTGLEVVTMAQEEVSLDSPHPGWMQTDPNVLLQSVNDCIETVAGVLGERVRNIKCNGRIP